jgi:RNA polymerase sigma-70 factor (ECF subfamily)
MYVVCLRYTKSQQEAEDVLQDSFIKVFKNLKGYRGDSRLDYWIKRIVVNTALNSQRKKLYMYPMVDIDHVKNDFDHSKSLSSFQLEELLNMIKELPAGCQTVFNLFAIEGYSHKEIAEMLKVSEGTSKSQFSRARKLLQEKIAEDDKIERYEKIK